MNITEALEKLDSYQAQIVHGPTTFAEINRLRRVLHGIADSRPDAHMDIEKNPELVNWICDTCHKASVGAYPSNV